MSKIERVNTTDLVVNIIKSRLLDGTLKVGDKLPRESDLAEELGVGRSSLREGIKILHAYGVVESRQGEGTFVIDKRAENFFEFFGFMPGKENMRYFMELRRVLEVGNIIAICGKVDEETYAKLETYAAVFDEERSIKEYVDADREFHRTLIGFSDNPMLIQVNNMITAMRSDLLYRLFEHKSIVQDARKAHHRIIATLRSGSLADCIDAVSSHLNTTEDHIENIY